MSKKILVTSLAALSLSLFSGSSVLAEENLLIEEPRVEESGLEDGRLEQLRLTAQSLTAKLETLLSNEEPLPVSPENSVFLMDTLTEINVLLDELKAYQADPTDIQTLLDLRTSIFKLYLIQYEAPELFDSLLTQIPTLEGKRYDDAVDFHDFDAELDDLLGKAGYLDNVLDFVQEDLNPEEFANDKAYLAEAIVYLSKLQEELYAAEGETVAVPEAPVYWGAVEAGETSGTQEVPGESDSGSSSEETVDPSTASSQPADETPGTQEVPGASDSGSSSEETVDPSTASSQPAAETPGTQEVPGASDSGSSSEETVDPSTASSQPAAETPGTQEVPGESDSGSSSETVEFSTAPSQPAAETPGTQGGSVANQNHHEQGSQQSLLDGRATTTVSAETKPSGQVGNSLHTDTIATTVPVANQTKAVLPKTSDVSGQFQVSAGLLLAGIGLSSMKRRKD